MLEEKTMVKTILLSLEPLPARTNKFWNSSVPRGV